MNSFEFNKIAGAVLGTALLAFGLNSLAGAVYHSEKPEKPGFAIAVAEADTGAKAGGGEQAGGAAGEEKSLGTLLASADAGKGQAVAKQCAACHDFTKGGPNKTGPNLYGLVNRPHASHEGFSYSEAMAAHKGEPWTYEALNAFLTSPKAAIPGTKMAFGGIKSAADRANLLAYLQTVGDEKVPFPAP